MQTTETLIEILAAQLSMADRADSKDIPYWCTEASKTVAELEKLGVDYNTAYDRADVINGVADRDTIGLA